VPLVVAQFVRYFIWRASLTAGFAVVGDSGDERIRFLLLAQLSYRGGMLAAGAAYPFDHLTTFVVNLRHALYSASVQTMYGDYPAHGKRAGVWLTDESFATVITHYRADD